MRQRTTPREASISYSGAANVSSLSGREQQADEALAVGVVDADEAERGAREEVPVRAREALEVDRSPQRVDPVGGEDDLGRLHRAHRAGARIHRGRVVGLAQHPHPVGDGRQQPANGDIEAGDDGDDGDGRGAHDGNATRRGDLRIHHARTRDGRRPRRAR